MIVKMPYGKRFIEIDVPEHSVIIEPEFIPGLKNEREDAFKALKNPIGTPPLKKTVRGTDTVAIVISDITRPTPSHRIVPWLVEELNHVPEKNFIIINGTGSHRGNTEEELVQMLGEKIVDSVKVINHDAFDETALKYLGKSKTGAGVYLNRDYCEADIKIATGFIEPHLFAGFSGGPKCIMPGIAGIDTIMHFHSAKLIGNPKSTWGLIDGNPVQEEAVDVVSMCRPDFLFNVTLNQDKEITGFFAGDVIKAHRKGTQHVKEHAMVSCPEAFDIVITTNSGYPLDQNLYQSVKGMSAAHGIVKWGGAIISIAECSDGIPDHGNFGTILQMRDTPGEILDMINSSSFSMFDQWEAQKLAAIQTWADVYLYSELSEDDVKKAKLIPCMSVENILNELLEKYGRGAGIAVLPSGPLTVPYIS